MPLSAEQAATTELGFADRGSLATVREPAAAKTRPMLRRGSVQQGRALETLGHAIEYLVDSRLFLIDRTDPKADRDAMHILMRCSREVFSECPEVVTLWNRVDRLCRRAFARGRG
jgi:hypothetical protein